MDIQNLCAVLIVTNTFNIVMAVFDVAQSVISQGSRASCKAQRTFQRPCWTDLEATLEALELGSLLGLWLQSLLIHADHDGRQHRDLRDRLWPHDRNISRVQKRRFSSKGGVRAFWEPGFSKPVKKSIKDVKSVTLASSDLPRRETTRGTIAYRKNRKLGKPSTHD